MYWRVAIKYRLHLLICFSLETELNTHVECSARLLCYSAGGKSRCVELTPEQLSSSTSCVPIHDRVSLGRRMWDECLSADKTCCLWSYFWRWIYAVTDRKCVRQHQHLVCLLSALMMCANQQLCIVPDQGVRWTNSTSSTTVNVFDVCLVHPSDVVIDSVPCRCCCIHHQSCVRAIQSLRLCDSAHIPSHCHHRSTLQPPTRYPEQKLEVFSIEMAVIIVISKKATCFFVVLTNITIKHIFTYTTSDIAQCVSLPDLRFAP